MSDTPTLNLIQRLVTAGRQSHLFFVGAYRSNGVSAGDPLMVTLDQIRKTREVVDLPLGPLDEGGVARLIAEGVVDKAPGSKASMKAMQAAFNTWAEQSGRPLREISRVLAMSIG